VASILQPVVLDTVMRGQVSGGVPARKLEDHVEIRAGDMDLIKGAARLHRDQPVHARGGRARYARSLHGREAGAAGGEEVTEFGWEVYPPALSEMIGHISQGLSGNPALRDRERMLVRRRAGADGKVNDQRRVSFSAAIYLRGRNADESGSRRARLFPVTFTQTTSNGPRASSSASESCTAIFKNAAENRQGERALVLATGADGGAGFRSGDLSARAQKQSPARRAAGVTPAPVLLVSVVARSVVAFRVSNVIGLESELSSGQLRFLCHPDDGSVSDGRKRASDSFAPHAKPVPVSEFARCARSMSARFITMTKGLW